MTRVRILLVVLGCWLSVLSGQWLETTIHLPDSSEPLPMCYNSVNNKVCVGDNRRSRVFVIDGATNAIVATVPTDSETSTLCYNPVSNKVYAASYYRNNVTIIDGVTDSVRATIAQKTWSYVHALCCITERNEVFCPSRDSIMVIDGATDSIIDRFGFGGFPEAMCYNPANGKVYAGCRSYGAPFLAVIDAATRQVLNTVNVPGTPAAICVDPVNDKAYCANYEWPASFQRSTLSIIDGAGDSLLATIEFPDWSQPVAVCCNPENNRVYCANWWSSKVAVIDGVSNQWTATVSTSGPNALLYNAANNKIYCTSYSAVSVIVGWSSQIIITIPVGDDPRALAWNPVQNRVYVANHASSSISVLRDSMTGVAEPMPSDPTREVRIPTIVRGVLRIGSQLAADGSRPGIELLDASGRRVVMLSPGENDVSRLAPGVYFIRRPGSGGRGREEVRKVVIQR